MFGFLITPEQRQPTCLVIEFMRKNASKEQKDIAVLTDASFRTGNRHMFG